MTTFALVHGSGEDGWAWHLVQRALRARGHDAVAPDLPTERDDATWDDCADVVVGAVGPGRDDVVVVGLSAGGFVVPLVAARLPALLQVHVAAMVPAPGESAVAWFDHVGWDAAVVAQARQDGGRTGHADPAVTFHHDVPVALAREAARRERPTSDRLASTPWPAPAPPAVPARYVVTARDRFLPPALQRRVAAERLGITTPDVVDSGHCAHLARPDELADLLVSAAEGL